MNIIARLEYELAYNDSAVHRFNHYTTRTPPVTTCIQQIFVDTGVLLTNVCRGDIVSSALVPTTCKGTQRGQITRHANLAMKYIVFSTTRSDTSCQSAREKGISTNLLLEGTGHCEWPEVHGLRLWLFTNTSEQICMPLLEMEGSKGAESRQANLKVQLIQHWQCSTCKYQGPDCGWMIAGIWFHS